MVPLRLTVEVPVMSAYAEQWGRRTVWIPAVMPMTIETMVHGLRRVRSAKGIEQSKVKALAYIQKGFRNEIPKSAWVDSDHAWVDCLYAENRKSLAAFRDCDDDEWISPDAPKPVSVVAGCAK
jgi:hypothetical protein